MRKLFVSLLAFTLFLVIAVAALVGWTVHRYATTFFQAAGVNGREFIHLVKEGWNTSVEQHNGVISVLILGLDEVPGRDESVLTDSIMLALYHIETGEVTLVPIPRDLWIAEYKTKINALYFYGIEKYPGHPEQFPKEVVEQISGMPIQYVVTLSLQQVAGLIDALGGVDVEVQRSFTDTQFPRPNVDVAAVRDPNLLYETVTFTQGTEHMSGERALTFMRSRFSSDLAEGTDDARSKRQQQVITAVINRLKIAALSLDLTSLGSVYAFYNNAYSSLIPPQQVIAIGRAAHQAKKQFVLRSHDILPFLVNPPLRKYDQWVYEPRDTTWGELKNDLQTAVFGTISE